MSAVVRGWCPTAYHPMAAGDGWLVRVRPRLARLTRVQVQGLCAAALAHGSGEIDVTNRANLQLRGVARERCDTLLAELVALDLVERDPTREARRTLLVAPEWQAGDATQRIADALLARLADLPVLPGKFGFAIDAGAAPVLRDDPADLRIERGAHGGLILRADGQTHGVALAPGAEVAALVALATWFVATGGGSRIARHPAPLPDWATPRTPPAPPAPRLATGAHRLGAVDGLPFGRISATALAARVAPAAVRAIRLTPWRRIIVEGGVPAAQRDPATLGTDACVGAPACPQSSVATRALAERLAPLVSGRLHVSGCAKGCARAQRADVVVTGRDGRFDLAFDARAGDPPLRRALDAAQILTQFGAT